ncbi:MAG: methyltransferase domain-containing protein [Flavobacterium sp.]|nr:MAG: methyltransferase domain-containing protein [Flavobacterium sp.]
MRIISGKFKGRRINPPKNLPVRPTTDMSKESLFNVLNNRYDFDEITVLDLFAGTGNVSYEFGSRGTESITCVDEDPGCIRFIKQTASEFDFNISAIRSNVFSFVDKASESFDVIFADPPYHMEAEKLARIVSSVFDRSLIKDGGMLIIEHSRHAKLSGLPQYAFQKNYGGSVFSFFSNSAGQEDSETLDDEAEPES